MTCDTCGSNAANVQFTEIVNGEKRMHTLCSQCASGHGIHISVSHKGSAAAPQLQLAEQPQSNLRLRCLSCDTSLAQLRRKGRVGCPDCYEVFEDHLRPLLRRVHGCVRHIDSDGEPELRVAAPLDIEATPRRQRSALKDRLRAAIAVEDYELAAEIRDELRTMSEAAPDAAP